MTESTAYTNANEPSNQGSGANVAEGALMVIGGAQAAATGVMLGRAVQILTGALAVPAAGTAHLGSLGAAILHPLHVLGGAGLTFGYAAVAAAGGGYLMGLGINRMVPWVGQGEFGNLVYELSHPSQ
jgi:hypothetical protein